MLPAKSLKTLHTQITEEFNDREQIVRAENAALRQGQDNMESRYREATTIVVHWQKEEASIRKTVMELCSELSDMQVEPEGPILENVQKVLVHAKAIALRMDTVEIEYKAKIEELKKQDPNVQLRVAANEIAGLVAYRVKDMTHLLETAMESWSGIEKIDVVTEVHEEI